MTTPDPKVKPALATSFASFQPYLFNALHGYSSQRLLKDISAGVTVGIVALPLAMAFAMASGLKPEAGIFTAIFAGFLISSLGGSRVQIGGPAGAFIVIVYGIVERYGLANLIIATAMSGVMLFAMGLFKLGTLVRFIPVDGLMELVRACRKNDVRLVVCGLMHQPLDIARRSGLLAQLQATHLQPDLASGLACALRPE